MSRVELLAAPLPEYVGDLRARLYYTEEDAGWFFGRESERRTVIGNLRAAGLTLLYAESGVGKSSLLRAGVASRLREIAQRNAERGSPKFIRRPPFEQRCVDAPNLDHRRKELTI